VSLLLYLIATASAVEPLQGEATGIELVNRVVSQIESGDVNAVKALLEPEALITDYSDGRSAQVSDLVTYAHGCKLQSLKAINARLVAQWACAKSPKQRVASFWTTGDKISSIGFGFPVITVPSVPGSR
jgi:hypothetical protein